MEFRRVHSNYYRTLLLTMMMFKWGIFCSESSEKCLSGPCQNGATCVDTMDDYVCLCPRETVMYMGKDCEQLYDGCVFAACPNCTSIPGTEEYTCACPKGFSGPNCTVDINECESDPCSGERECVDSVAGYFCLCPRGYGGADCKTPVRDCSVEPCLNNGSCVARADGYGCECSPGFRGERCEEDVDECLSRPCKNGALCMDGVNQYRCFCVPGFQGYHCEIDINECASRPCENNATCINGKDRYACECLLGFAGVNCETEIDECASNPCQNGATCQDLLGLYNCECVPGFEGLDCEINIDECASMPCLNNGNCTDLVNSFSCDCGDTGYMGERCEEDIPECASNPCQNGATCLEGVKLYTCVCWPGYEGEFCEVDIDECVDEPCENGGQCIQRSDKKHYGEMPKRDWEFYAYAAGYLCRCQPGYTGETCSVEIDECESSPCQNGGGCEDKINGYTCSCLLGFTGVDCEVNIDECESQPCHNGGVCEDGVASYTCLCPEAAPGALPWGGRHCDVQLTGCVGHACENAATCRAWVDEGGQHGHTCLCPPGFYDEVCATPTTFSFSTPGFVVIEVPHADRSRREVDPRVPSVSMRFRTTLPNMLLFHRGHDRSFLSLEIVGGGLHARAVSGDVALEARFTGPVNDGGWREVGVAAGEKLVLVLKGTGCDSEGCRVEDGRRKGAPFHPPPDALTRVFVGGVPEDYLDITMTRTGFIGCIEDLLIDSRPVLPQNIPSDQAQDLELGCTKTEWCHTDPCSSHGLCVDLWTSFRCDCHRPFHGDSCADEYPTWTFSHEDTSSYASYAITDSHGSNFSISFFMRSLKPDGLLLQLRRKRAPYFSVFLQMGRVLASAPAAPPATAPVFVATGEWQLVEVELRRGSVAVMHGGVRYPLGAVPEVGVEAGDVAYVGGLPRGGLPRGSDVQAWGGHFKGCLQDVRVDRVRLDVDASAEDSYRPSNVVNVDPGCVSDDTCRGEPCQNGGECAVTWNDFSCSCPTFFTGKVCETRVWCVSNPCVMGSSCVDLPDGYECIAEATFENNALRYSASGSLVTSVTSIYMELRTRAADGLLLRASRAGELFSVGLLNSSLLVRMRDANSVEALAFSSRRPVADGKWHRVRVSMEDPRQAASRWLITVDGWGEGRSADALASPDFLREAPLWLAEDFVGCLGTVRVGEVYLPFVDDRNPPQQARFVREAGKRLRMGCIGAPVCLSQPCLNDGTCQDLFNQFGCSCAPGWEGQYCQDDIDDCASSPCIHGACTDLLAGYLCDCFPGYAGKRCHINLDECQDHACENGGTCIDGVNSYTCLCPPDFSGPLCQWQYPPLTCEEDVQCVYGVCNDGPWGANCTCTPGYGGDRCEAEADECESNPCQNGGTCLDRFNKFLCLCAPGFFGPNCETSKQQQRDGVSWLMVAIPLGCCFLLLVVIGLSVMVMTARKKRQSEGTYSPSQQEVAGARLEMDSMLKVPPEERLI
ncbi:protein crumbs homolog 2a [Megalops cyprinoides]|uniref:protein crumbs homolog 2a n=1 Tax=Megalops cyprinoides TaxID=118141 RepID=UPI001863FCDB|nr:protein crumbs homolog 2a [Megalops cyprinoides]